MARQYTLDDSEWGEVRIINGYAVFIGYLMMGVRGLGVLVFTWTTVVLLGGFVSNLRKTDFWCLTGITLVQTAGVFNFLLKEKLSDMGRSWWGLLLTVFATIQDNEFERRSARSGRISKIKRKIAYILAGIQGLVLGIILFPLGVLYMLGLYVSAGVSLWRLIENEYDLENEYGNAGGANKKPALQVLCSLGYADGCNKKPALQVLYSLAVAQGVLFGYKTILACVARKKLAKFAADGPGMVDEQLVAEYLEETLAGCEKDPSFAAGRNLVRYGADLMMEAKSNEGFIAGIRVLGGAIKDDWPSGRKVLAKHLLTRSDSWSHVFQRLLETVGPRSPYSREIREHAARIVALVARGISLEQFPGVIEFISSVLDPSSSAEEESNQPRDDQFDRIYQQYNRQKEKCTVRTNFSSIIHDYERVELLETYELDYLVNEIKSPAVGPMQRLVQYLLCKRRTRESGRSNAAAAPMASRDREESETGSETDSGSSGLDGLLQEAANIIHQLAVDGDNRRIMSNTVIHKFAMTLLRLHRDNSHDPILDKYWVQWLVIAIKWTNSQGQTLEEGQPAAAASGGGGQRSGEEIQEEVEESLLRSTKVGAALGNAIDNIKHTILSTFDCLDCQATQKKQGIQILLYLSLDMSFIMNSQSRRRRLAWILALILVGSSYDMKHWRIFGLTEHVLSSTIRRLAREKLPAVVSSGQSGIDLQLIRLALQDLTGALSSNAEDISIRTHAAIIMRGLFSDWDRDRSVKEILLGLLPKVVEEILIRSAPERQAQDPDMENGVVSEDDVLVSKMSQDSYTDNERLRKALVSLFQDGYMASKLMHIQVREIASKTCQQHGKSFEHFESLLTTSLN